MVGETIKIGFDGTSVKRGMSGIMGNFNKLGRGIGRATRQVGIGAARRMGSDLFGVILQSLKAIPNELDSLSKLNKQMQAMGTSTGVTTSKFLALREAISKATGRDADEAGELLGDISERLGEAAADPNSGPGKALASMGMHPSEMRSLALDDVGRQMEAISGLFTRMRDNEGIASSMTAINELLGEVGKQMAPLWLNYNKEIDVATEKTKGLNDQIKRLGGDLESIFDIKSAIGLKFSELALSLFEGVKAAGVEAKSIAEWINNLKVSEKSKSAGEFIAKQMKDIERQGPLDWIIAKMQEIGAWIATKIGEGIKLGLENSKELIKELMPSINPFKGSGGTLKSLLGFKPDKSSADNGKGIERNTGETNNILRRIADGGSIATYA
jgi:hypothetical protein